MYYLVNIIQLVAVSEYFKNLASIQQLKEGDTFDTSFPFHIKKSHALYFLNVIQNAQPYLRRLILPLSLEEIFLLTDYFQVDCIFKELSDMFSADLKNGPLYLKLLIHYRGITDPLTAGFLQSMSDSFGTTQDNIVKALGPNLTSLHKLKTHLRNLKRFSEFHKSIEKQAVCFICHETVMYRAYQPFLIKDAFLATCCGNPIHINCIESFKSFPRCPLCTTELVQGCANIDTQTRFQAIRRNIFRDHYRIPFDYHLPSPS